MKLSLSRSELIAFVNHLLTTAFDDGDRTGVPRVVDRALERLEHCFSRIALPGYRDSDGATFDHLHGDQCAAFIYWLANSAWVGFGDQRLAKQFTALNRMRHALLVMYDTHLPDIFLIPHTVGTVIGKAEYADYFVACQNVTVANDLTTHLSFGAGVVLFPGALVVGTGTIGEAAVVTANTTVQYQDIPADTVVSGRSPNLQLHARKRDFLSRYFLPPYPGCEGALLA